MVFSNSNIFDDDYILSANRVIVILKVTQIATCGSLASTVSDRKSDDDAFFGPPLGSSS